MMKLALYSVKDVNNLVELMQIAVGDIACQSEY
jgi:hypothetical protein